MGRGGGRAHCGSSHRGGYALPECRRSRIPFCPAAGLRPIYFWSVCSRTHWQSCCRPAPLANWLPVAMELVDRGRRGRRTRATQSRPVAAGMHRVAIASLVAFGLLYYVQSMSRGNLRPR